MSIGIGSALGAYEITALLGEGGMGRVFRARDTRLKREVAHQYVVSPDGSHFLINTVTEDAVSPPIAVILNWRPPVPK